MSRKATLIVHAVEKGKLTHAEGVDALISLSLVSETVFDLGIVENARIGLEELKKPSLLVAALQL